MEFEMAKQKAISYIGISKKTEAEVYKKLKNLKFEEEIIDKVIIYLKDLKYINDNEYVKAFIRQEKKMEKYSVLELTQKLLIKGINKDLVEREIGYLAETDYEERIIARLKKSKLSNLEPIKVKNYLYRRGFRINE
ncbi:MAG: RecX family transcriptional regulator [Clostridia bacterium]|nr:RecX family transcriptional regulator [Clostridia bacterium]